MILSRQKSTVVFSDLVLYVKNQIVMYISCLGSESP